MGVKPTYHKRYSWLNKIWNDVPNDIKHLQYLWDKVELGMPLYGLHYVVYIAYLEHPPINDNVIPENIHLNWYGLWEDNREKKTWKRMESVDIYGRDLKLLGLDMGNLAGARYARLKTKLSIQDYAMQWYQERYGYKPYSEFLAEVKKWSPKLHGLWVAEREGRLVWR